MHSLEEKNHLSNELERLKKKIEETEQNKARLQSQLEAQNLEIYNLKLFGKQHQPPSNTFNSVDNYRYVISVSPYWNNVLFFFSQKRFHKYLASYCDRCKCQVEILKELQKSRLETENVRRQMLQQEIHFNIQQTEALTR